MQDAKEVLRQLLAGVAELHDKGIIHKARTPSVRLIGVRIAALTLAMDY